MNITLSDAEANTVIHDLRIAAERFDDHAKTSSEIGHTRIAEQFARQAADSRALAEKIEAAQ